MIKIVAIFVFLTFSLQLNAQYQVKIISENDTLKIFKTTDSIAVYDYLNDFLQKKQQRGFIKASFDSIEFDSLNVVAYFVENEQYKWQGIEIFSPQKISLKSKNFEGKFVNFDFFQKQIDKILYDFACKGYPFASVSYDSLQISGNEISTKIIVDTSHFITFDSIYFADNIKISEHFLQNYLQFKSGEKYNQQIVDDIPQRLDNLTFLQIQTPSEIEFHKQDADLYLYLKNQKVSQFSGLLGFTNANGKLSLVGQADFKLVNTFKHADQININWTKTKELSQNLNFDFMFPYIFSTNIGVSNALKIKKIDTSYIDVLNKNSFSYYFSGFNNVSVFVDVQKSIVFDTNSNFTNFSSKLYGISLDFYQIDNYFMPTKGYSFNFSAGAGNKNSVDTVSNKFSIQQNFEIYFPFFNDFVLKYSNFNYFMHNSYMSENELFLFGGENLMRGFDKESLSASLLFLNSLELRYVIQKKSSFFIFTDYSVMQHKTVKNQFWEHLLGIGAGINLQTKNGLLSATYAVGKTDETSFIFKNSKFYFGFSTYF